MSGRFDKSSGKEPKLLIDRVIAVPSSRLRPWVPHDAVLINNGNIIGKRTTVQVGTLFQPGPGSIYGPQIRLESNGALAAPKVINVKVVKVDCNYPPDLRAAFHVVIDVKDY
jgi:hypothetical protein